MSLTLNSSMPPASLLLAFADAAGHQPQFAVIRRQHGDDAVGFAVVGAAEDDATGLEPVHALTGRCSWTADTKSRKEVRGL